MISDIGKELKRLLYEISDDRSFVKAVMLSSKTETNWKILVDFIESGEDISSERLLLFAIALGEYTNTVTVAIPTTGHIYEAVVSEPTCTEEETSHDQGL